MPPLLYPLMLVRSHREPAQVTCDLRENKKRGFRNENLREVMEVDYDQAGKKEARQSDVFMVIAHPI